MVLDPVDLSPQETPCSYHPDTMTLLRCSRCGKPICPKCAVRTPVGMRCPDCAGVRGLPTYRASTGTIGKAAIGALLVAAGIGLVWGFFPDWEFFLALAIGFGVAETVARFGGNKRGFDLMIVGWTAVVIGLLLSRVVLAYRLDIGWESIQNLTPYVENVMYLQIIPDGLFALIPFLIIYIRFR